MTYQNVTPTTAPTVPVDTSLNALALTSLVSSVLGFGVLGVVFGHVARRQIRRTGQQGWAVALAGLIVGYISIAAFFAFVVVYFALLAFIAASGPTGY